MVWSNYNKDSLEFQSRNEIGKQNTRVNIQNKGAYIMCCVFEMTLLQFQSISGRTAVSMISHFSSLQLLLFDREFQTLKTISL